MLSLTQTQMLRVHKAYKLSNILVMHMCIKIPEFTNSKIKTTKKTDSACQPDSILATLLEVWNFLQLLQLCYSTLLLYSATLTHTSSLLFYSYLPPT